ncbi:MAG: hypothetical protein ABI400_05180, partial [Lacisediminihabitans sp.]
MFGFGYGWGNNVAGLLATIVSGLFALLILVIVVGLIFLLVRFLLVATRAAQLYVAEHEPPRPVTPVTPAARVAPAA